MDYPDLTLGKQLKRLVEVRGVSHGQVTQVINVDKHRLSRWLNDKEPMTIEYLDLMAQALGADEEELLRLYTLHSLGGWRARLRARCRARELARFGAANEQLSELLLRLSYELVEAESRIDGSISPGRLLLKHLAAADLAVASVVHALHDETEGEAEATLFTPANIINHLRFPHNYYIAALVNLSDDFFIGGTELGDTVQRLVDEAIEASTGWTFIAKVIRQHAHHVNARFGKAARDRRDLKLLEKSDDIQDRRMVLIGRALHADATEGAWNNLFDAMRGDAFRRAVLAFDVAHYGDNLIERDGLRPLPTRIRQTALRYFAGLASPDPNNQLFCAQRLMVLLDHSTPAMVHAAQLAEEARSVADAVRGSLPAEATEAFNRIGSVDHDMSS